MKRFLSLFICACLLFSMSSIVLADESKSTTVQVIGEGTCSYEFNVPLTMNAGETKSTTLSGTWGSDSVVRVTAPSTVTMINDGEGADKVLEVTYEGFFKEGDDFNSISLSSDITVEDATVLFGSWTGIVTYNLYFYDEVKVIRFSSPYHGPDYSYEGEYESHYYYFVYEDWMTWGDYVESEYNWNGCSILDGVVSFIDKYDNYVTYAAHNWEEFIYYDNIENMLIDSIPDYVWE